MSLPLSEEEDATIQNVTSSSCVFLTKLLSETLPHKGGQSATDKGGRNENVDKAERFSAYKESGPERTGGVDGCSCQVDADKVDENEGQTDCKTREIAGALLLISCSEDDKDKDEGGDDLNKPGAAL